MGRSTRILAARAIVASAWLLAACGQREGFTLRLWWVNHSDQAYTLGVDEFMSGSRTLLSDCDMGRPRGNMRLGVSPSFQVKLGPGPVEQNGEDVNLPVLIDSSSMPPMGDAGYLLTIEADGDIRFEPLDKPSDRGRVIC